MCVWALLLLDAVAIEGDGGSMGSKERRGLGREMALVHAQPNEAVSAKGGQTGRWQSCCQGSVAPFLTWGGTVPCLPNWTLADGLR